MKKWIIAVITAVVVIVALANSLYLYQGLSLFWNDMANIIGVLSGIATLVIALLLYRKFGVDQSLVDKQADMVLKLIDELCERRFVIDVPGRQVYLNLHRLDINLVEYKSHFKGSLVFEESYLNDALDISMFSREKLLPTELAKLLVRLEPVVSLHRDPNIKYGVVSSKTHLHTTVHKHAFPENMELSPLLTSTGETKQLVETDYYKLLEDWKAICDASKKWIEENASGHKLNFAGWD